MDDLNTDNVGIYVDALFNLAHKATQNEDSFGTGVFQALLPFMLSQDQEVQSKFHDLFNEKADGGPWEEETSLICEAAETMISCPIPLSSSVFGQPSPEGATFSFFSLGVFAPGLTSPLLTPDQRDAISAYFRKTNQVHFSSEIRILPALVPLDVYCSMPWPDLFKAACLLCDDKAQIEVIPEYSPTGLYVLMAVAQELVPQEGADTEDFDSSPFSVSDALDLCLDTLPENWEEDEEKRQTVLTISQGGANLVLSTMAKFDEILNSRNVMISGIPQSFKLFDEALYEFRLSCLVTLQLSEILDPQDSFESITFEDTQSIPASKGFLCNVRHVRTQKVLGQVILENDSRLFSTADECGEWYQMFFESKKLGD